MSKTKRKKDLRSNCDSDRTEISRALKLLAAIAISGDNEDYVKDELLQRVAPLVNPGKVRSWGYNENDLNTMASRDYVFGPPVLGGSMRLLPAFSLIIRRKGLRPYAKFSVLLLETANSPRLGGNEEKRWIGGWRFECPEWIAGPTEGPSPQPGAHDYYHAQAILGRNRDEEKAMRAGESEGIDGFAWSQLDTTQPAFPLAAKGPFDLVMVMLVSLYSLKRTREVLSPIRHDHDSQEAFEAAKEFLESIEYTPPPIP